MNDDVCSHHTFYGQFGLDPCPRTTEVERFCACPLWRLWARRLCSVLLQGQRSLPSCTTRRKAETAAHLTDHLYPRLPVRQWVLSVPKRLRYFMQRQWGSAEHGAAHHRVHCAQCGHSPNPPSHWGECSASTHRPTALSPAPTAQSQTPQALRCPAPSGFVSTAWRSGCAWPPCPA